MSRSLLQLALPCILAIAGVATANAQVVPSESKLVGRPVQRDFGTRPADSKPPSSDPRDLNGMYQQIEESDDGSAFDRNLVTQCAPHLEIGARGYPEKIVQTPGQITFIQEFNHIVRRIHIGGAFAKEIPPTYAGYSVGHWQGNTLVITTRGVKGTKVAADPTVASVVEVVEHVSKQADGTVRNDAAVHARNHAGELVTINRKATLLWRPDIRLMEYMCEDGAGFEFK